MQLRDTLLRWMTTAVLVILMLPVRAQLPTEPQIKAVFLYNFTHFVQWPSESFTSAESPLIIGIYGAREIEPALRQAVATERVNGHPIQIQYFENIQAISSCHILYIGEAERTEIPRVLKRVNHFTLTVSDADDFNKQGGMFRFYKSANKIRLAANKHALDSSQLTVSSKLLRLVNIE
jgi:hypothetical protein